MARNNMTNLHRHESFIKEKISSNIELKRLLVDCENDFLQKKLYLQYNVFLLQPQ